MINNIRFEDLVSGCVHNLQNKLSSVANHVDAIRMAHSVLGGSGVYSSLYGTKSELSVDKAKLNFLLKSLTQVLVPGTVASLFVMINTILPIFLKYKKNNNALKISRDIINGKTIVSFAVTEPSGGSFVFDNLTTKCRRKETGWTIIGGKKYITNAPFADYLLVMAKAGTVNKTV